MKASMVAETSIIGGMKCQPQRFETNIDHFPSTVVPLKAVEEHELFSNNMSEYQLEEDGKTFVNKEF